MPGICFKNRNQVRLSGTGNKHSLKPVESDIYIYM